jgi:ABC-type transport system substrate-binding protein
MTGESSDISRRHVFGLLLAGAVPLRAAAQPDAPPAVRTLRYAFRIAETNFDPAQITDMYSRTLVQNVFEAPLEYAFLARPVVARPNTAAEMPQVSDDYKTFTIRIRPGIFFTDDPAFKGQKRELVAQDYVYSLKRHYDPRWRSGNLYLLENAAILGLSEVRQDAIAASKPFDYDREVQGLKAIDRYTFQVQLAKPQPRFLQNLTDGAFTGALAREVVEFYGDKIGEHPVGTGPFMLSEWKRSSRSVWVRNPDYREVLWNEEAPADDPMAQEAVRQHKGKRLPLIDRVEVSIVEENQPRWLSFLRGDADILWEVPPEFADLAMPNNKLAPHLRKQGIQMIRYPRADVAMTYFAMEHPLVGGYTADKVALRRAIALANDIDDEIRLVRRQQAIPAQGVISPSVFGYDAALRTDMSEFNRARAKALLDLYGYVDRNGDGWRDQPDGQPLVLQQATQTDQFSRQLIEHWQKNINAIGVRIEFNTAKWPENLKASRAGKLMMWQVGWSATDPDGDTFLAIGYGLNKGQSNHSRFDLPAFNALYEAQRVMPDGPERAKVMQQANRLLVAYMPMKIQAHRIWTDLAQPWMVGYHRNVFVREFWKYVDVDPARRAAAAP